MRPRPCADHSIIARAVGTAGHIKAFVCCARELVQQAGTAKTCRAFHEEDRWRTGLIYLFGLDAYGYTLFAAAPGKP